ncbi:MAG: T9SS C-terminal target domain-containing protein [Bacteroidia bacterium]|nr:MAG: T9SS C-terminal target domain-containing protein [Bacteroidia bacterium]
MKTKHLLLVIVIGFAGMIFPEARAQFNEFQLIKHETDLRQDLSAALHFYENKEAVIRFREVDLSDNVKSLFTVEPEDLIVLNLFSDVEHIAEVQRVEEILEDNVTVTAKFIAYDFSYAFISTTEGRTLAIIHFPEQGKQYEITSDPVSLTHYLIEIDPAALPDFEDQPSLIPPEPTPEEIEEQKRIERELEMTRSGPLDHATIDVIIVYTPAARNWANNHGGGILNRLALAVSMGNTALNNSQTYASIRLVHRGVISYTEYTGPSIYYGSPYNFWASGSEVDLIRLTEGTHGFDTAHSWRNIFGADLVQLFTTTSGGVAWVLDQVGGRPNYGYSVSGVGEAVTRHTPIHEMGHNMGCGHHKQQNFQPGPELYSYSAGWRWQGSDNVWYSSVMSYFLGGYFPSNPVSSTRVPYFSNPSINYMGAAIGHATEGDNARTIRNTKHVVAAYRSTATISCIACPGYDFAVFPTSSWKTNSSSIGYNGCKVYRFNAIAGRTYIFQTGCGNGATANFDTFLQLLNSECSIVAFNDDGCENFRSKIEWVATYDGYAYLVVRGYSAAHYGSYTLAYQRPPGCNSNTQFPSATLNPESNWKYQNNIYPGEFSRFNVTSGTTYHWSLCNYHGGEAPYDSQLTLRHGTTNSLIAYSDDECGTGMDAFISWTADFTGTVKVVVSKYNCQSESTPTRLAYKSGVLVNPFVSITPSNREVLKTAGSATYNIISNTSWIIGKDALWISSVSPYSGTGNATITVNYLANPGAQRVGTLTVSATGTSNVQATLTQMPGNDPHCNSLVSFGGPLSPNVNWQYHDGMWAGEYVTFYVFSGIQYHFSLCPEHGGNAPYDSELTLRRADNNLLLAHNQDACGDDARISWTSNFSGLVKLILTRYPCQSMPTNTRIAYKSGALTNIAVALSPANWDVLSGAGTTYYYLQSNSPWSITKNMPWITSVTPSSGIGNATIAVGYTANTSSQRIGTITASSGEFSTQSTLTQMPFSTYCNSVTQWGGVLEPEDNWNYLHFIFAGEYARFSVESGTQYHWSLCPEHGGDAAYDSRLTLRNAATNSFITHNSTFCGDDGKISWTASFTGEVKVIVTKEPCDSYGSSTRLAYKKGALTNPSISISPVTRILGPLGGSVTYNVTSNTTWTLGSDADWAVPSQTSGTGNATITVNYTANTGSDRMATFTGVANYGPTVTASLSQYDYCANGPYCVTQTPTDNWQYINCIYGGEYAVFPVAEGERYNWSLCATHGAEVTYESQLTLRNDMDNAFLAYEHNNCGPGDNGAFIDWTADFTGEVRVYVHKYDCQSYSDCTRLGYKKGSPATPYLAVIPPEQQVGQAAGTTTFALNSNTSDWVVSESIPWLSVSPDFGSGTVTLTVNYDANPATTARSGEITVSAPYTSDVIIIVNQEGASIPDNVNISPTDVIPGEYLCFNATQTITVEGLTIQSGGVVNLIAGQNIIMLPGTHAHSGSYLHAWISSEDHCGIISPPVLVAAPEETMPPVEQEIRVPAKEVFFKVYPNPTTGDFTIEMQGFEESEPVLIQIFTMQGNLITNKQMPGAKQYTFSLAGRQTGMYLVRVMQTDKTGVVKIMKK